MLDCVDSHVSRGQQRREGCKSLTSYLEAAVNLGPAQPQRFVAWAFLPRHRTLPRLKGYHQLPLCDIGVSPAVLLSASESRRRSAVSV